MRTLSRMLLYVAVVILTGCIRTEPMHEPIYPASGVDVEFTLDARSRGGIDTIELYETISTVDAVGNVGAGTESLLQQWTIAGTPTSTSVSFTKIGGYLANRLVQYRYRVRSGRAVWFWSVSKSHDVTFSIRPYPVSNQPAPVYAQGDVDHVFDVVFIPDTDITNMNTFRGHVRSMITDAVLAEPSIIPWNTQFNFYINPLTGTATDFDRISIDGLHQKPTNWANISFAEAKVLMHRLNLRDYATGGLFSTEQQNRGTMMHEGGHSLFDLADEYAGGSHWQEPINPNNWDTLAGAQTDAPNRGKTAADAVQMGTSGWYKLCINACPMKTSGLTRNDYDEPCTDRVVYSIFDNAANP